MKELRYTLLSDGVADRALLPLLTRLLQEHLPAYAIQSDWADLRRLPRPPRTLTERVRQSVELYPCDLLFVHRDAETAPRSARVREITKATRGLSVPPVVCVIPIRMHEAWLLCNETALRIAAGNPRGRQSLQLPRVQDLERLPDPKGMLHNLLVAASGLNRRRQKSFPVSSYARRVAEFIDDLDPLRQVSAFEALESDIKQVIQDQQW